MNLNYDLRNVFDDERYLLSLSGFYPRRIKNQNYLYFCSAFINTLVSHLQLYSMIGQMVVDRRDVSKLTDTLLFFMTHFTFLCKLTNFGFYKKHLLNLEDRLSNHLFSDFPENKLNILKTKVEACKKVARVFRILCILCIIFYSVLPLMAEGQQLPLPGWLPYDVGKFYLETCVFQILSVCISAYNNSSIDILTWKLITVASGELEILRENLKDLYYSTNFETKLIFENCVKHHTAIFDLVHDIETVFSKGIFLQFLASVVIICFTGFQLMVVPIPSIDFVFLVMYLLLMLCQVAMYCWYGHEVMTTSNELGRYCYMSNWYNSDIKVCKSIIIFLERTKKPMTLTAGNFVTLSLNTLSSILRSSYSYFAVLQRLYNEDSSV